MATVEDSEAEMTMDIGDLPGAHLIEVEGEIILPGEHHHRKGEGQEGTGQGLFHILLMLLLAQKGAMATALGEVVGFSGIHVSGKITDFLLKDTYYGVV